MKRLFILLSVALSFCLAYYPDNILSKQKKTPIIFEAEGISVVKNKDIELAREQALKDALRSVLERAVGMIVSSENLIENYEILNKNFYSNPLSYIVKYDVTEEKQTGDLYQTKIKAYISFEQLMDDLKKKIGLMGGTKPYLDIEEVSELVEEELKRLSIGRVLFNSPREMKVGIKNRVEARITKSMVKDLTTGLKGRGIPEIEEIKVGSFMKVSLLGDDFEIKALSDAKQPITREGFTHWDWDVTPLKSGFHSLVLKIAVRIKIPYFDEETKDYPVFERLIKIRVNLVYSIRNFIKSHWQWIISTVLGTGIIGWLVKKKKSHKTI